MALRDPKHGLQLTQMVKVSAADFAAFRLGASSYALQLSEESRVTASPVKQNCSEVEHTDGDADGSPPLISTSPKLWIVSPMVDMLFVCGGMLWLLAAVSMLSPSLFASKTAPMFMVLTQIGAVFFLDAHNGATILRIFNERELRAKHKILWLWAPLVLSSLFVLCLFNQILLLVFLRIYMSLVPHHLTAQSYGICLMYFARAKVFLTRKEMFALKLAFTLMAVTSIARNFSGKAVSELMGVPVPSLVLFPDSVGWSLAGIAWVTTLGACGLILKRIKHAERTHIPTGAIMVLFSTLTLLTLGPSLGLAVVFSSAFFHASQYLVVSGLVHLKKTELKHVQLPPPRPRHLILKSVTFWGQTIVLGTLLYLALPTALAHFGLSVVNTAVAVLCFASLHHFIADAVIWRMRDPKNRAVLSA